MKKNINEELKEEELAESISKTMENESYVWRKLWI